MGTELVRYGDDKYVLWSEFTGSPSVWGTRKQLTKWLIHQDERKPEFAAASVAERFGRADGPNRTSAMWYGLCKGFIYAQLGHLPLDRMEAFLDSYNRTADVAGDYKNAFDCSLLDPFED